MENYDWENVFKESILKQIETIIRKKSKTSFDSQEKNVFFNNVYRNHGKVYTIVFRQNLSKTNVQYGELFSIFSNHFDSCSYDVEFILVKEYIKKINSLIDCFFSEDVLEKYVNLYDENISAYSKEVTGMINKFANLYSDIFSNLIPVTLLYGSCILFIPSSLDINKEIMKKICAISGYIHSIGESIFVRNLDNINTNFFLSKMEVYFNKIFNYSEYPSKKIMFIPFSNEDFVDDTVSRGRSGLDDLKIYMEKLYIGQDDFLEVLSVLENTFGNYIKVISPYPNDDSRQSVYNEEHCIWLFIDRDVDYSFNPLNGRHERPKLGRKKFLLCYDQFIKNSNDSYIFNENMVGWYDNITIPSTLMAAMFNLTNIFTINKNSIVKVLDPFVGSGASYIQSKKYKNISFIGVDKLEIAKDALVYNNEFFDLDSNKIEELIIHIFVFYMNVLKKRNNNIEVIKNISQNQLLYEMYERFYHLIIHYDKNKESEYTIIINELYNNVENNYFNLHKKVIKEPEYRFKTIYYIIIKALKRNTNAIKRERYTILQSLENELVNTLNGIYNYYLSLNDNNTIKCIDIDSSLNVFISKGKYSLKTNEYIGKVRSKKIKHKIIIDNCLNFLDKHIEKYDIIITDPPYGFNTSEDVNDMAELYKKLISLLIARLNDNGQLVMCLPATSYTGKSIEFFTQKNIVIMQILKTVHEQNKIIDKKVHFSIPPKGFFDPPYYWKSSKSLKRDILYFSIKNKN